MPTLDISIAAGGDDMNHRADHGNYSATGDRTLLGVSGISAMDSAYTFTVNIPKGATVDVAKLTFNPINSLSGTVCRVIFNCEDVDDAVPATTDAEFDTVLGQLTGASAAWEVPATTADVDFDSPSLIAPIQAVIDRSGWAANNRITIVCRDNGSDSVFRNPKTFETDEALCARLHIEFTPAAAGGPVTPQPTGGLGDHVVY